MEKSYIKDIDTEYLINLGFSNNQIEKINILVNKGIKERLYTKTKVPYHNIKHIERVLIYALWILNEKAKKGQMLQDEDILLYSALYHDCGRSRGASNKMHGIVGANIARDILNGSLDDKTINSICLLIKTHATIDDTVQFENFKYTKNEKENIQILSDILKDSDALDRNRIKLFSFAQCDINRLRTEEAKKIYSYSDSLLTEYKKALRYSKNTK